MDKAREKQVRPPDLVGYPCQEAVKRWQSAGYQVVSSQDDSLPHQRCRIIRQRLIAPGMVAIVIGEELYNDPTL